MIIFLFLMTFLAALIVSLSLCRSSATSTDCIALQPQAVQMFQGIPDPDSDETGLMNFYQVFNSFLGMYQVSSFSHPRFSDDTQVDDFRP